MLTLTMSATNDLFGEYETVPNRRIRVTPAPAKGQTVSGYGSAIPTQYMVKVGRNWYRVKVSLFGNSGLGYVTIAGQRRYIEIYG